MYPPISEYFKFLNILRENIFEVSLLKEHEAAPQVQPLRNTLNADDTFVTCLETIPKIKVTVPPATPQAMAPLTVDKRPTTAPLTKPLHKAYDNPFIKDFESDFFTVVSLQYFIAV